MKPKMYQIQDREAGNVIESGLTLDEARLLVDLFEEEDKDNNAYISDFYKIVKEES